MDSLRKKSATHRNDSDRESSEHSRRLPDDSDSFRGPIRRLPPQESPRKTSGHSRFRRLGQFILLLASATLILFGYFSWKVGRATTTMNITPERGSSLSATISGAQSILSSVTTQKQHLLRGESEGRTNILILGKASEHTPGQKLTDTIMVASLDFARKKIGIISLPRDLSVTLPEKGLSTKLNALYQYDLRDKTGMETVGTAVSDITGLPLHYFVALDYDGFINVIDALGGVSVYVERDLLDTRFPGPNYSYETFEIKKGWRDLDGETALKYARERHSDPEGDFGRSKRQQDILAAIRDKASSLKVLLNPLAIGTLIDTLGEHVRTDITPEDIRSFIGVAREFDTKNIATSVVDAWKKESLLRVSHVQVGPVAMFVLVPRTGNWSETRALASNLFDLEKMKEKKTAIETEAARIAIRNESGIDSLESKVRTLLTDDLGMKNITLLPPAKETIVREVSRVFDTGDSRAAHTRNELIETLSLQYEKENNPIDNNDAGTYDIIIALGKDMAQRFDFEEGSLDTFTATENDLEYQKKMNDTLITTDDHLTEPVLKASQD